MTSGGMSKDESLALQKSARNKRFRQVLVGLAMESGAEYPGNIIFDEATITTAMAVKAMERVADESFDNGMQLVRDFLELGEYALAVGSPSD